MKLVGRLAVLKRADRTAVPANCAVANFSVPIMPAIALPNHNLVAESHILASSAVVLVTKLGSNGRKLGGQGIVPTDRSAGTEGTA